MSSNAPKRLAKARERVKVAVKAARLHLMEIGVVGSDDPFVWWTGKPVDGVKETLRNLVPLAA
jgi:hypothetical protein